MKSSNTAIWDGASRSSRTTKSGSSAIAGIRCTRRATGPGDAEHDEHDDIEDIAEENKPDDDAKQERSLRCLGAAVILHWNSLPSKLQKELFASAGDMDNLMQTKSVRVDIARFLHLQQGWSRFSLPLPR
jgi:hypothetical protein